MPDLTIEAYYWCSQNEYYFERAVGSKGETYEVSYGRHNHGMYGANWDCTCPGFKFRGKCKHVDAAMKKKCDHGWEVICGGAEADDWVETKEGKKCPNCGSDVSVVRVGV